MPKQCLLDLDGVLLDFVKAAHAWYGIPYEYEDYPYEVNRWDILPSGLDNGMTTEQFWNGLTKNFWANVPWMYDGKQILKAVEKKFGKENVAIMTCPTLSEECSAGKHLWISENLPDYSRRFLIGPAKQFCASPDRVLVDDGNHNVEAYRLQGGPAILVPRKWNDLHQHSDMALEVVREELKCLTL
jgi:5'(3')-deoxyribonucleotidase